jgi:hypothetical protein
MATARFMSKCQSLLTCQVFEHVRSRSLSLSHLSILAFSLSLSVMCLDIHQSHLIHQVIDVVQNKQYHVLNS